MSRSFKHVPGWTDNGLHRRFAKRQANKRLRKTPDVPNGRAFRKYSETWDICDYRMLHFERRVRLEAYFQDWANYSWCHRNWHELLARAYMK